MRERIFLAKILFGFSRGRPGGDDRYFAVTGREEDHYIKHRHSPRPSLRSMVNKRYLAVPELVAGLAGVVRPQDIVLFMGAGGDIDHLAHQFAKVM